MQQVKVVIGAGLGDEGKGLMTDYFISNSVYPIVIRFCGGPQAGHTVTTHNFRHVFHHYGSGTLRGAPTYLSRFFIANPIAFLKEKGELLPFNSTKIFIDKNCLLTTPYDMMLNELAEMSRGNKKYGSCGFGINETVHRNEINPFRLTVRDITSNLKKALDNIRTRYVPQRLEQLGIHENIPENYAKYFASEPIRDKFIEDAFELSKYAVDSTEFLKEFKTLIFEGSQGLMLDQNHRNFPYVTRANTGIKNVLDLLEELKIEHEYIEITYVTRCYATRHGEGPFPTETKEPPFTNIVDKTNVHNQFQGALRFGLLDLNVLNETIRNDLNEFSSLKRPAYMSSMSFAMTCLDQADDPIRFVMDGKETSCPKDIFPSFVSDFLGIEKYFVSSGTTQDSVKHLMDDSNEYEYFKSPAIKLIK